MSRSCIRRFFVGNYQAVLAFAIAVSGVFMTMAEPKNLHNFRFVLPVVLSVSLVVLQAILAARVANRARAAREELRIVVADQLAPLARRLSVMASRSKPDRRGMLTAFAQQSVVACTGLADQADRARTSFMERKKLDNGADAFVPTEWSGRSDGPRSQFVYGADPESDEVWQRALDDQPTYYPDLDVAAPASWDKSKTRHYKTFITVPVRAGDELVGLLTINSPQAGDLTDSDVESMQLMAGLLGAAVGMAGNHQTGEPRRASMNQSCSNEGGEAR